MAMWHPSAVCTLGFDRCCGCITTHNNAQARASGSAQLPAVVQPKLQRATPAAPWFAIHDGLSVSGDGYDTRCLYLLDYRSVLQAFYLSGCWVYCCD